MAALNISAPWCPSEKGGQRRKKTGRWVGPYQPTPFDSRVPLSYRLGPCLARLVPKRKKFDPCTCYIYYIDDYYYYTTTTLDSRLLLSLGTSTAQDPAKTSCISFAGFSFLFYILPRTFFSSFVPGLAHSTLERASSFFLYFQLSRW